MQTMTLNSFILRAGCAGKTFIMFRVWNQILLLRAMKECINCGALNKKIV